MNLNKRLIGAAIICGLIVASFLMRRPELDGGRPARADGKAQGGANGNGAQSRAEAFVVKWAGKWKPYGDRPLGDRASWWDNGQLRLSGGARLFGIILMTFLMLPFLIVLWYVTGVYVGGMATSLEQEIAMIPGALMAGDGGFWGWAIVAWMVLGFAPVLFATIVNRCWNTIRWVFLGWTVGTYGGAILGFIIALVVSV